MYLRPYSTNPGPDLEVYRPDLELLLARARGILPGLSSDPRRPRYNPNNLFLKTGHLELNAEQNAAALVAGQRVAYAVARTLDWNFIVPPEKLNQLRWMMTYATRDGLAADSFFPDELHSDAEEGLPFGVWVPDPRLASFELLTSPNSPSMAVCVPRSEMNAVEALSLLRSGLAEVRHFEGNLAFNVPAAAVHGRQLLNREAAVEAEERWSFRISAE